MAYLIELIVSVGAQVIGYAYDRAIIIHMIEGLQRPPAPAAVTIHPARPVWYRVQTGAAYPASGRRSALVLARLGSGTACAAACAV